MARVKGGLPTLVAEIVPHCQILQEKGERDYPCSRWSRTPLATGRTLEALESRAGGVRRLDHDKPLLPISARGRVGVIMPGMDEDFWTWPVALLLQSLQVNSDRVEGSGLVRCRWPGHRRANTASAEDAEIQIADCRTRGGQR